MRQKIRYGKSTIEYDVIKSKRCKTSQITVDNDNVIVRVPYSKDNTATRQIVKEKAGWIFKKQLEIKRAKSSIVKPTYSDGSTIPYLGKNCILQIKTGQKNNSIKYAQSKFFVTLKTKLVLKKQVKKLYDDWVFQKATKYLPASAKKTSSKIGLKPSKIEIKSLKGRWGSLTKEEAMNLNSNLMKTPKDVIDYIIIHELCHLKIKDHSTRYWNLVARFDHDYQNKIKWLESNEKTIL